MSKRTEAEAAAERVRKVLYIRSGMSGLDTTLYNVGDPDDSGRPVPLTTSDLEKIVRYVLGDDAETVDPVRSERIRRANRSPVPSGHLLAGMRRELADAPDLDT